MYLSGNFTIQSYIGELTSLPISAARRHAYNVYNIENDPIPFRDKTAFYLTIYILEV